MTSCARPRAIPFFDYPGTFLAEEEQLTGIFRRVGGRGAFILQAELREFEERLAAFTGARFAVGVGNATDALHLALRAAGIGPGDEVIFASHTMVATAAAIHFTGARPVPVECGADHLLDARAAAAAVTARTRAVLVTHLNGRMAAMTALEAVAARHGLQIFEDAAQALGARHRDRGAGTWGVAGALSFYPAKSLGGLGDGGAVLTSDPEIHERLLALRDHGRDATGAVTGWGFNSRLDNLQAAILTARLARYPDVIRRRRELAACYHRELSGLAELVLPPAPEAGGASFDVFQNFEVEARDRDALRAALAARGTGTLVPWGGKAVHQWPALGFAERLPYTERLFERLLLLPLHPLLDEEHVGEVSAAIREFYGK